MHNLKEIRKNFDGFEKQLKKRERAIYAPLQENLYLSLYYTEKIELKILNLKLKKK